MKVEYHYGQQNKDLYRQITPLTADDSFLVIDKLKDDFDSSLHFHPEFELSFISNGTGMKRTVGDSTDNVGEIELVLVGPNLSHGWKNFDGKSKDIHQISVLFSQDLFSETILQKAIMKPIADMLNSSKHGILFTKKTSRNFFIRLKKVIKLSGFDFYLEMVAMLHELANSKGQLLLSSLALSFDSSFQNTAEINKINDFIHENYESKITLEQVSNLVNKNAVSFNTFIKNRTGKTFIEYLNDVRIGYASKFLVDYDLSIAEIAFKSGFNNVPYFNKLFKKVKGTTPTLYRKNHIYLKRAI